MKKVASLYDPADWAEDSGEDLPEDEFENTFELRKRFKVFKVALA